jgi:parallel beta-helix repeat protein
MTSLLLVLLLADTSAIAADTKLEAGRRVLSDGPLRVTADGVTLDLGDAELVGPSADGDPDSYQGIGLLVEGRRNVTIRNGRLRGFRCAILVRNCENVVLEGVDVSGNFRQRLGSTPDREDTRDWLRPHDNDEQQWRKRYGAGICIENSKSCEVRECVGRDQQNGLLLDRATACRVLDSDFSFNSGWGIALWRSNENLVSQNKCDWCVRGYSHGVYDRGQDSAGILVFEQCSRNVFFRNSATHSGDGFFLYAGEETLRRTGKGGCNDNLVAYNDFSHAVANAIEATFSRGNRFLGNRCDDSNYGVWAGYSFETLIEGNSFADNRVAGVAIEHGSDNRIVFNTFRKNRRGVQLWWDEDEDLLASAFGKRRPCRSESYLIARNSFDGDRVGVELTDTSRVLLAENHYDEVEEQLVRRGRCEGVRTGAAPDVHGTKIDRELPKHRDVFLPASHPRGMEHILVGTWGPLDPTRPHVFPESVVGWDGCRFRVGGGLPRIEIEGDVDVEADPRGFVVKPRRPGLHPFRGEVRIGEARFPVEGVALAARWKVRHWAWKADPREAFAVPDDAESRTVARLDFPWGSGGPGALRDRFATYAVTTMPLPKGRYEIRTVSDDGVRVTIDGKVVQEDWTWHAPREKRTVVELGKGQHEIVVEHFEIDGHAVLRFDLRPAR